MVTSLALYPQVASVQLAGNSGKFGFVPSGSVSQPGG